MNWAETGRFLIYGGLVIAVIGLIMIYGDKFSLGHMPGDVTFGTPRFKVYIPIATCLFLSVIITVLVNIFAKKL